MYRVLVISLVATVLLTTRMGAQTPAPAPQQKQAQADEPPPVLAVPPGYKYDPRGRRDPFVNPIPKPVEPEPEIPVVRPPGLRGLLIAEAVLVGVVSSKEPSMNKVIIQAPGNKTYFAGRGDALFDAVIKEIRPDAVVFTLVGRPGSRGQPPQENREVVRRVNPVPGGNQ